MTQHMKKIYTLLILLIASTIAIAQQQPDNPGFEDWQNTGTDTEEPTNWSGMMTGHLCGWCSFGASQRVFREDSEVHSGSYSARIESTSAITGITVNGTMTTGRVTAPSTTASEGYNQTLTANAEFHHQFVSEPDSLVFWARYNITDASDSARVSFVLHDQYSLRDPQDAGSASHVVASARANFQTNGTWQRISVPFVYSNPSPLLVEYLLGTFTSSYVPGAGNSNATLYVDDLAFVYNTVTSVDELAAEVSVYPNPSLDGRFNLNLQGFNGNVDILVMDVYGRIIQQESRGAADRLDLEINAGQGMYMLMISDSHNSITERVIIR